MSVYMYVGMSVSVHTLISTIVINNYKETLPGNRIWPIEWHHCQWPWVTLKVINGSPIAGLFKRSFIQLCSIMSTAAYVQSVRDRWVACCFYFQIYKPKSRSARIWLARRRPQPLPSPTASLRLLSVRTCRLCLALACLTAHVSHATGQTYSQCSYYI